MQINIKINENHGDNLSDMVKLRYMKQINIKWEFLKRKKKKAKGRVVGRDVRTINFLQDFLYFLFTAIAVDIDLEKAILHEK